MKLINKYWMLLLTAVFAVVEICYYTVGDGKFILAYHEMFQMFMWGWDYLANHLLYPGGLAEYVGEMITQFNYMPSLGASLLVMLLVACQGLMWLLIGRSENRCMYPLSFVPALAFCYLFTDENAMLSSLVATDVVMACMVWYERIAKTNKSNGKGNMIAAVFAAFATPVLYWLIGPLCFIFALHILAKNWKAGILPIAECIVMPLVCSHLIPYSVEKLFLGVSYYRFYDAPILVGAVPLVVFVLPFIVKGLNWADSRMANWKEKKPGMMTVGFGACVGVCMWLIPMSVDSYKTSVLKYDYLLRLQKWEEIVSDAEKVTPNMPITVSILNLALAEKNVLGERGFDFYQNGMDGLIPAFNKDGAVSQILSDIYFQIGMTNASQQYAFEAQEGLQNFGASAYLTRRLAETNLINGQYGVALKYLRRLQKTTFYSKWATETIACLGDEERINTHPLWGWMRKNQYDNNFLFSEQEVDKMFGLLFLKNSENAVAMQYLVFAPILQRDAGKFSQYYQFVRQRKEYYPRCCYEIDNRMGKTWEYLNKR